MQVQSVLKKSTVGVSPLLEQTVIRPKGQASSRVLMSSLMLTSLVDAFSILVIFLLMNAQNGIQEMELRKMGKLPMASHIESLQKGVVIRIENGNYDLDDQMVGADQLVARLGQIKESKGSAFQLIIQADRQMSFQELSPILRAGSEAGINQFKFVVIEGDSAATTAMN